MVVVGVCVSVQHSLTHSLFRGSAALCRYNTVSERAIPLQIRSVDCCWVLFERKEDGLEK